jgi:hypothetical protein
MAYLLLGIVAATSAEAQTISAAWLAMELIGWVVIVPLALVALASGILLAIGTAWGLLRHYWVVISLLLTVVATIILLLHMPTVTATASVARIADPAVLRELGGDVAHPAIGLLVLTAVLVLNVFKSRGVTAYGRRKRLPVRD